MLGGGGEMVFLHLWYSPKTAGC